ncbi:MAG: hypothetical protein CMP26_13165 [Roseibacillus sp.]|nr:hypothetical protein [Roseibacillus sp.]
MSRTTAPATRRFHCDSCRGEIEIPFDLPPTTAPCPHCGTNVLSPPPPVVFPESFAQDPLAAGALETEDEGAPIKASAGPEVVPPEEVSEPEYQSVHGLGGQVPIQKKQGHPVLVFLGALVMVAGALLALVLLNNNGASVLVPALEQPILEKEVLPGIETPVLTREEFIGEGWKVRAAASLQGFLQARSAREKSNYVIGGGDVLDEMERFYAGVEEVDESDTPAEGFTFQQLDIEDRRRGLFLMRFERSPEIKMSEFFRPVNTLEVQHGVEEPDLLLSALASKERFSAEPMRVMSFFKEQEGKLLLDWHVYTQTKYRLFKHFINTPRPGGGGVFRLMVREALPLGLSNEASEGVRFFRFSDPAFGHDRVTIKVPNDEQNGQILSEVAWINIPGKRDQNRYATVRLRWTDEEESKIALEELVCWEFLGLGGEIGNASPEKARDGTIVAPRQMPQAEVEPQPISYLEGETRGGLIDSDVGNQRGDSVAPAEQEPQPEFSENQ